MSEKKPKGLEEGPPIWVETLMTKQEWDERRKKYPTSTRKEPPQFFKSDYEWRWNMGKPLSADQIMLANSNIERLREYRLKKMAEELASS